MSGSGVYHVMVRGINKQDIFLQQEDCLRYLSTLGVVKARSGCLIRGYCLMSNHVHLLLQERAESIGQVMKRIGVSYVRWYNNKYARVGHLFQDRFLSEAVEDDAYLLTVLRYIHQNPLKAGLVADCGRYPWSSYSAYAAAKTPADGLVDTGLVLDVLGGIPQFIRFTAETDDRPMRLEEPFRLTDEAILALLNELLADQAVSALQQLKKVKRDGIVGRLRAAGGTNGQVARLTGLSLSAVQRAMAKND